MEIGWGQGKRNPDWANMEKELLDKLQVCDTVDEATEHIFFLAGKMKDLNRFMLELSQTEYGSIPGAWAIPLYMSRN